MTYCTPTAEFRPRTATALLIVEGVLRKGLEKDAKNNIKELFVCLKKHTAPRLTSSDHSSRL